MKLGLTIEIINHINDIIQISTINITATTNKIDNHSGIVNTNAQVKTFNIDK
jgi:hypothetical protein